MKTPPGETTWKIGGVRAGKGAIVRLTQEQADTLNKIVPEAFKFQGI